MDQNNAGVEKLATIEGSKVTIPAQTSYVLVDKSSFDEGEIDNSEDSDKPSEDTNNNNNLEGNNSSNPSKTGDETKVLPIIILLLVSALAVGIFVKKKQTLTK